MSMILLAFLTGGATRALAAKVYWVGTPSDADNAAVARTVAGATIAPFADIVPTVPVTESMTSLGAETAAVKPLFDVFDGELQVMARLQKATSDAKVLKSEADRQVLFHALMTEGYAVERYFGAKLGTDKAAAPYRTGDGADAVITAWADAASLYGASAPTADELPDAAARIAWDATQAAVRARPSAALVVGKLASGANLYVDGQHVAATLGARVPITAGRHHVHVQVGDSLLWVWSDDVGANATVAVEAPFGPAERDALVGQLGSGKDGWTVAPAVVAYAHGEATYLAVPGGRQPRLVRIDTGTASNVTIVADKQRGDGPIARVAAGAGWVSTGDFFLQNVGSGAPYTTATVNAVSPAAAAAVAWRFGLVEVGAGVDAEVALGAYHSVPTGGAATRAFVYPHVAAGIRYAQLTLGPEFPWYFGVGAQATVPVYGPLELYARGVYGVPLPIARAGGDPSFTPTPAISAWGGVAVRFGG